MKKLLLFTLFNLILITSFAQKSVVIQGLSDGHSLRVLKVSPFGWNYKYYDPINIPLSKTATGEYVLAIDRPQQLLFSMRNSTQQVFVTPGDTVSFVIRPYRKFGDHTYYSMYFSGKNAPHYNYAHLSDSLFRPRFKQGQDIRHYKDSVALWRNQQLLFLESYRQEFHLSDSFMEYAVARINNTYVLQLYGPLSRGAIERDNLPEDYFLEVDRIQFNNDRLLDYYLSSLLIRYINYYVEDTWSNFDVIYQNILQNFTGETRAYLLSAMIGKFAEHQGLSYATQLLNAIKSAPKYVRDPEYLTYIKESEANYLKINQAIPDSILLTTYLKPYGTSSFISLKEVLKKYEGQTLYIDFWASWCGPCRGDITESHEAKQFLKENDVVVLYISIDIDEGKWVEAVIEDQIRENQYLTKEWKEDSPLRKYLHVYAIPYHVILDSTHKIKELNAPRLNKVSLPQLKTSIINATQKITRYD